jgi:hypothetical protein
MDEENIRWTNSIWKIGGMGIYTPEIEHCNGKIMKELGFPWISHCPIRLRHGVIIWMSMINSLVPDIHVCIEIY